MLHTLCQCSTKALISTGLLALVLASCAESEPEAVSSTDATCESLERSEIKLGIPLNTYTLAPVYNALDSGLFADEGLDVELVVMTGGTTPQAAMLGGSVDLIETGLSGLLQPIEQGVEAKAIWGGILATPYDLYAQPEITSMADAEGKSIHITSLPSDQGVMVQKYLTDANLSVEDVQLQEGGGSPIGLEGLERGTTDISILVPPTSFEAEDKGFVRVAATSDYIAEYPMHMVQGMSDFVDGNPCTIKAFLRGLSKGTAMATQDQELTAQRVTEYAQVTEDYAIRAVESFQGQMFDDGRIPDDESMDTFWEIYSAVGAVSGPFAIEEWFDDQFVSTFDEWK